MNSKVKLLMVLGIFSLFAWQCAETPTGPETQGENEIWIFSNKFEPSTLTVSRGTRVTWKNKDNDEPHSVDPGTLGNPTNDFLGSPNLDFNRTFSVTFNNSGTIHYYCSLHQTNVKQGTIIVQ